ncbi:site-specific integrase [Ramlibacter sp.]|uniref:site-specific integrase n=1 Tax=Ramlibacter sp. TaxID=1917967 RepID=UPI002C99AECB|nr:site-specific integrase [Ramlibacter sp.]HWI81521.1 site-specific integrase [Ramlibacter sp.]
MASIRRRGATWHVQIRRKDHTPICKAFAQRRDAEVWARDVERKLDRGEDIAAPAPAVTVGELLTRYADDVSPAKRGGLIEQVRLRAMAKQSVGRAMAAKLTTAALAAWRDERLRTVSGSTVVRELGLLHRVMVTARHEWGVPAPMAAFEFLKKPKQAQGRVRRLPAQAAQALLEACRSAHNPFLAPAVTLALETGMRRGEIVNLEWAAVDLKAGLIHIGQAKNGHSRLIPMTTRLRELLAQLQEAKHARPVDASGSAIHQAFERARDRARNALQEQEGAGQDPEVVRAIEALHGLRFHDLRHEAISRSFEKGLTMVEAAEVSGHRTLAMLKRYAHADLLRIAAKLAGPTD